jgi:hypothetical protein
MAPSLPVPMGKASTHSVAGFSYHSVRSEEGGTAAVGVVDGEVTGD